MVDIILPPTSTPTNSGNIALAPGDNILLEMPSLLNTLPKGSSIIAKIENQIQPGNFLLDSKFGQFIIKTSLKLNIGQTLEFTVLSSKEESLSLKLRPSNLEIKPLEKEIIFTNTIKIQKKETLPPLYVDKKPVIISKEKIITIGSIINTQMIKINEKNIEEILPKIIHNAKNNNEQKNFQDIKINIGSRVAFKVISIDIPKTLSPEAKQTKSHQLSAPNQLPKSQAQIVTKLYSDNIQKLPTDQPVSKQATQQITNIKQDSLTVQEKPTNTPIVRRSPVEMKANIQTQAPNKMILKMPIGEARIDPEIIFKIPEKSEVLLELINVAPKPAMPATVQKSFSESDSIIKLFKHWGALDDILDELPKDSPKQAKKIKNEFLPKPGKHLAAKIANFAKHVQKADISWVGKDILPKLQQANKSNIVEEFISDFRILRDLLSPKENQNSWQTLIFPISDEKDIYQNKLFVRNFTQEQEDKDLLYCTRFIVELSTKITGDLQIDGLVKQSKKTKRKKHVAIIMRSHISLLEFMRNDIESLFISLAEIAGITGNINFQVVKEFPINPAQNILEKVESEA